MPDLTYRDLSAPLPQPTQLLGRAHELAMIARLLTEHRVRLLTITGPAGVGKTRLALEVGARLSSAYAHGIVFVDLAPIRDPRLVLPAIAQALGLPEAGSTTPLESICAYLQDRSTLLILDNFEQVLPASAKLGQILETCPGATLLVTSRWALQLQWEHLVPVSPLQLPDLDHLPPVEELAEIPAVALFLERARARRPDFTLDPSQARTLAELCIRLDGLPLAIELAAARLDVLPLATIAQRLDDCLRLLRSEAFDLPERHRSLHAAISWSYELLDAEEQRLFRHLGVFVGRVSLGAIAAVLESDQPAVLLDSMAALAARSLILPGRQADETAEPSFALLETMRDYARDQLQRLGELEEARTRHAHYFLALAERAAPELTGQEQRRWYLTLEQEHDNMRAALSRLLEGGEPEAALRGAAALTHFWWQRGYRVEGRRWLEATLRAAPNADPAIRSGALIGVGLLATYIGDYDQARDVLEEALALAGKHADRATQAEALTYLGLRAAFVGESAKSIILIQEALDRWSEAGGSPRPDQIGRTLAYLGIARLMRGEYEQAKSHLTAARAVFRESEDERNLGGIHIILANTALRLEDPATAAELAREGIAVSVNLQDFHLLTLAVEVALLLVGERVELDGCARLLGARDAWRRVTGSPEGGVAQLSGQPLIGLRERLEVEGFRAAYLEGRTLSFQDTASLTLELLEHSFGPISTSEIGAEQRVGPLSEREHEVLRQVAHGLSDKQIARELAIGERTVRRHLSSILNKLGAVNRPQAVAIAAKRGLI